MNDIEFDNSIETMDIAIKCTLCQFIAEYAWLEYHVTESNNIILDRKQELTYAINELINLQQFMLTNENETEPMMYDVEQTTGIQLYNAVCIVDSFIDVIVDHYQEETIYSNTNDNLNLSTLLTRTQIENGTQIIYNMFTNYGMSRGRQYNDNIQNDVQQRSEQWQNILKNDDILDVHKINCNFAA